MPKLSGVSAELWYGSTEIKIKIKFKIMPKMTSEEFAEEVPEDTPTGMTWRKSGDTPADATAIPYNRHREPYGPYSRCEKPYQQVAGSTTTRFVNPPICWQQSRSRDDQQPFWEGIQNDGMTMRGTVHGLLAPGIDDCSASPRLYTADDPVHHGAANGFLATTTNINARSSRALHR